MISQHTEEYTFTETFACVGDTFELSPADYADKDVLSYWFTGQPNIMEGLSGSEVKAKLDDIEPKLTFSHGTYQGGFAAHRHHPGPRPPHLWHGT